MGDPDLNDFDSSVLFCVASVCVVDIQHLLSKIIRLHQF